MPTEQEHLEIKNRATARLLALPGVMAVGLGGKEVGGQPTGELAIKIFVRVKRPPDQVPAAELIPSQIEGVPTDVIESGEIRPVAGPPPGAFDIPGDTENTRYRPLTGGVRIRREGSGWEGTLGCFMVDTTDNSKVYGLTNYHVVNSPDVAALVPGKSGVGQPSGIGSVTACCLDLVGVYAGGVKSTDGDEAIVQLNPGMQWLAEIQDIGVVTGKHQLTQPESHQVPPYQVRKRGARTQLTGGGVSALKATTNWTDDLVVIAPNPNPAAGARTVFFDYEGDSGSAVVNDAGEVVALVWGRDDKGNGYAYAILPLIGRFIAHQNLFLDVAVAVIPGTVNTVPGAAMVSTPPELAGVLSGDSVAAPVSYPAPPAPPPGWVPAPVPLAAAPVTLQRDLDRSATGRLMITMWLEHQAELMTLINTNRRVAVAWHRSGAAALAQVLARMTIQPEIALPPTINGQPIRVCLERMHAILGRYASPRLARDLARLCGALPDLGGLTYLQIVDALAVAGPI